MARTSNQRTAATFIGAAVLTALLAAAYLLIAGINDESTVITLRVSGRVAFAVLIAAFVARPLQQLVRAPWSAKLLRNRRLVGVTFAGIHTAHLGLILLRANQVPEFDVAVNQFAAIVYALIYVMLITSFSGPAKAIGPKAWKALHKVGIFALFGGFLTTQIPKSIDELELANGFLIALAIAALLIRLAAFLRNRRPRPQ